MLQQILRDMYIDPDLLAELDEEQKQILFCKMREEQIRRYDEYEKKMEKEEKKHKSKPKKPGGRCINFLLGKDGKEWVWIMGEHETDKTIEEIIEEEQQEKARLLAEQEAEQLRIIEEEEIQKKLKEEEEKLALETKKRKEDENKKKSAEAAAAAEALRQKKAEEDCKQKYNAIKKRHDYQRRKSVEHIEKMKLRRSSELYMSFKEARQEIEKQAKANCRKIEEEWEQQEKKSKKAEAEVRAIARRARDEHRKSLINQTQVIGALMSTYNQCTEKPALPAKPTKSLQNSKPTDRESVINWFKEVERPRGAGLDSSTNQVASWFHGVITRQDAEELLQEKQVGTFLVRVSERIWGYAISYRGPERCKHFLIDTAYSSYQFFGTNQIAHDSLADLIYFHESKPISAAGGELLRYSCPQKSEPPDYDDLFNGAQVETSYL